MLQNTLRAFIDNPEFTLAEVPLFLNPHNSAFRNYIVSNITHYPSVAEFWRYEFSARREREQQERMDAVLTRVNTLLTDPYVHDIVGQKTTTINFADLIDKRAVILVNLPANLAKDSRRFIGALLISELVHAVRNREHIPEADRHQFCIFVDEFQNFASADDDFSTLITEARKFGVATTIAHQERYGQFAGNQKLLGATAAAANKVFFQLTVTDAQELAPEFANIAEATEKRREAELVISPKPIEDIWERGHPEEELMYIRNRYLWIVDLLKSKPQEKYFLFDRSQLKPEYMRDNPVNFRFEDFDDWEWYRSSADMLRQGISLLNQYYYDWMSNKYDPNKVITDAQLQLMLRIIECLGGVFGFLPMLRPYIPEPMRHVLYQALRQYKPRYSVYRNVPWKTDPIKGSIYAERASDYDIKRTINAPDFPRMLIPYELPKSYEYYGHRDQIDSYRWRPGHPLSQSEYYSRYNLTNILIGLRFYWRKFTLADIPTTFPDMALYQGIRQLAVYIGMSTHELENLIDWETQPLTHEETSALAEMVTLLANEHADELYYAKNYNRIFQKYAVGMFERLGVSNSSEKPIKEKATNRLKWHMGELLYFVGMCLRNGSKCLAASPVKIPSGRYDETLTVERMQQDLINEMFLKLNRLLPHSAYAKVITATSGQESVWKGQIATDPPRPLSQRRYAHEYSQPVRAIIEENTIRSGYCMSREAVLEEIRERQERWRRGPGGDPPPTLTGGDRPLSLPTGRTGGDRQPPPTHYTPENAPDERPSNIVELGQPASDTDESIEGKVPQEGRIIDFTAYRQQRRGEGNLRENTQENADFLTFNDSHTPLIEPEIPADETFDTPEVDTEEEEYGIVDDTSRNASLQAFKDILAPFAWEDIRLCSHVWAWLLQKDDLDRPSWRGSPLDELKRDSERVSIWLREDAEKLSARDAIPLSIRDFYDVCYFPHAILSNLHFTGMRAAMLGETALAEEMLQHMIQKLESRADYDPIDADYRHSDLDIYDFYLAELVVELPNKATAKQFLRRFETKDNLGAALYIATELGDTEAVDRLLEQMIDQGLQASSGVGRLIWVIVTLIKAIPYNQALGKQLVKVVEKTRGVKYVEDEVKYIAYAGMLAAILGARDYAEWAIACCLDKKKYLDAGAITGLLGEVTATESILSKVYRDSRPSDPPRPKEVGLVLAALAKHDPSAAKGLWETIERRDPKNKYSSYLDSLAANILENLHSLFLGSVPR